MNTDEIFFRYWNAVEETAVADGLLPSVAVRLCLRLAVEDARDAGGDQIEFLNSVIASQLERMQAVQDAYDAGAALCNDLAAIIAAQKTIGPELRQAEVDRAQISMLNEWLADEEPALYHDPYTDTAQAMIAAIRKRDTQIAELQQEIAKMDADNSGLLLRLQKAEQGWAAAQADADRLALRVAQQPAEIHANGNGTGAVDPTPATASETEWGRSNPVWNGLTAEETEELYAVVNGEKKWRQLTKDFRRDLMQRVMSGLTKGGTVSMSEFDNMRPAWMPTANSLATSFGMKWTDMLNSIPF